MQINTPPLLDWQLDVLRNKRRFNAVCVGRRAGKTSFGELLAIDKPLRGGICWWIAPTFAQASIGWRGIKALCRQIPSITIREVDRMAIFPSGGFVQIKSGDDPDNLKGEGLSRVIFDEAALLRESVWVEAVRPALSDKNGDAFFLSTPKGVGNWFWKLYGYGIDPDKEAWNSWQLPTSVNPHIPQSEIDQARLDMPERLFRQEYLAEFIEDRGSVFRNVDSVSTGIAQDRAYEGQRLCGGLDWGRNYDFTALSIWDMATRKEVYLDRFTDIGWQVQRDRIKAANERFPMERIFAESNSIGSPNIEALQGEGMPVFGFETTAANKGELINGLALAIEVPNVELLSHPIATMELKGYELERLPSGKFRYGASSGMHDDTVIARCLALHAMEHGYGEIMVFRRQAQSD